MTDCSRVEASFLESIQADALEYTPRLASNGPLEAYESRYREEGERGICQYYLDVSISIRSIQLI